MSIYRIDRGYKRTRRKAPLFIVAANLCLIAGLSGYFWHNKPSFPPGSTESVAALEDNVSAPTITAPLPWPDYGQAAYGMTGSSVASSKPAEKPVPIASLAKIITALAIIKEKPLASGDQGPMITLSEQDVALYTEYLSKNGTVVPVEAGEQISQYQAMQAMLMSSANNISDSLTRWAFGSDAEYVRYANAMLGELGLANTKVADASGFSPNTVSTAQEMVKLGELYVGHPVLLEIATLTDANIPVAGIIPNYNTAINKDGLVGIKVGFTDEAGRCFMLANVQSNGKKDAVSLTVVLGAENIQLAMHDAETIIRAGDANAR